MGLSYLDGRYKINGLLAAEATVMQNLEKLCNACGTWLTYDIHEGHWAVIINKSEASKYSFDNSNIVGPITISSTGIYNLYNSVKVSFPHVDLKDQRDFVQITVPAEDRYPNEPDNVLELNYDIVNDPVQAMLLGFIELKQNRVDRIVKFQTDYSKLQVKAGDVIDLTNSVYGFVNKKFRVVTVREVEADTINVEIVALEYDEGVYDETNLNRYARSDQNGIISIGALPPPAVPTITKIEFDTRPRIVANTNITSGVVEAVEFWYSLDAALPEASRNYTLLTTQRPKNGSAFAVNEPIEAEYDGLSAGNIVIKTRSINSSASSSFSTPTATLFAPKQSTDAISTTTAVVNSSGVAITDLPATTIMTNVDGLFSSNANVSQSPTGIYGTFLNVFQANTAVDLRATAGKTNIDVVAFGSTPSDTATKFNTYTNGNVAYGNVYSGNTNPLSGEGVLALFHVEPTDYYKQYQIFTQQPSGLMTYEYKNSANVTITRDINGYIPCLINYYYAPENLSTISFIGSQPTGLDTQGTAVTIPPSGSYVAQGYYFVYIHPYPMQMPLHEGATPQIYPYYFRSVFNQPSSSAGTQINGYGWK